MPDTIPSSNSFNKLSQKIKELHDDLSKTDCECVSSLRIFVDGYNKMLNNREAIRQDKHMCLSHCQNVQKATTQKRKKEIIKIAEDLQKYFQNHKPRCSEIEGLLKEILRAGQG